MYQRFHIQELVQFVGDERVYVSFWVVQQVEHTATNVIWRVTSANQTGQTLTTYLLLVIIHCLPFQEFAALPHFSNITMKGI